MSCTKLNTVLLGGKKGEDGFYRLQRNILFSPVGRLVVDALPGECEVLHARHESEPELEGVASIVCPDGAGFAQMLLTAIDGMEGEVLVLSTPMPEVTTEDYSAMIERYRSTGSTITTLTCGMIEDTWHMAVCSIASLKALLPQEPKSLTETIVMANACSEKVNTVRTHHRCIAVYDACDAYHAQKSLQHRINSDLMRKGVSMLDPEYTYISPYSRIGVGTTILPGTMIRPGSVIGNGCTIGPNTILDCASVGDRTSVNSSQIYESSVGCDATVGPFAYIRPGCEVGDRTRIGDFVELKKSSIGNDTKVSHLTYIGDATVGERVNFGCGTVVVNYDGYTKNQTIIGNDCFIGCNTNLVSPVSLGDRVLTAAGTTVTKNVPDGALAVARARQENKDGWNDRRRRMHGQDT